MKLSAESPRSYVVLTKDRGAYCAMVIISLLDLPLDLPPDSEARDYGIDTFVSGLPDYLSRCRGRFPI